MLFARKYWVPLAVVRPPSGELMSVPPEPDGLLALILIPTDPAVVAAAVEVSISRLEPFQSKVSAEPDTSPSAAVVVVARAVPSARLKLPPTFT